MRRRADTGRLAAAMLVAGMLASVAGPAAAQKPAVFPPPPTAPYGATAPADRYQFAPGSEALDVDLVRSGEQLHLTWPKLATPGWDTALLAVQALGAEADPWVQVTVGTKSIELHLDPNAWGMRHLNLSGLRDALKPGAVIEFTMHALTLAPGAATLRVFDNRLPLDAPILVVAPHPDDAEIAAFGLYAGRNATVVTVTSGNAGDFNYRATIADPAEHYRMKGYLRAVDSVTVPWQGGIPPSRTYNLGYFDATLAALHAAPDQVVSELYSANTDVLPYRRANLGTLLPVASRTSTWTHLVEDLATILKTVRPGLIVMPHPLLDSHPDHAFTAVAVTEALERWKGNARFLLYTNHIAGDRYPWGPATAAVTLPPWPASDLALQAVYSHPLDPALQRRKLFALESMHDLRLSPEEQSTMGRNLRQRPDFPRNPDTDYFRRAPRPNELFFSYDQEGVRQATLQFLMKAAKGDMP